MRKQLTLLDALVGEVNRRDDFLDRIEGLLEWGHLAKALSRVEMRNEVGRRAIAPMILFRLLQQAFYNLSDGEVESRTPIPLSPWLGREQAGRTTT